MKCLNIFLLLLSGLYLQAQDQEVSIYDYGFQIDEVMSMQVPDDYASIYSVRLNDTLYAGKSYEVTILVDSELPKRYDSYTYNFWLFESGPLGRLDMDRKTVKSETIFPKIRHEKLYGSSNDKAYFKFFVTPKKSCSYLTVGVKNNDIKPIYDIKNHVTVRSLYVYPVQTKENEKIEVDQIPLVETPNKQTDRKLVSSGEEFVVNEETVSIFVYDHRRIDGDIVTLYLNDEIVLERLLLKRKKKEIKVNLKPGKNTLILFAENLGEVPPNTAAIKVVTKTKEYEKVLKADLKQSEYLIIYYKPKK